MNERIQVFYSDIRIQADISHKSDIAARNRKVASVGYEATDVLQEVHNAILEHLATGGTIQGLVDGLLEKHLPAIADTSADEAHSLAFAKLAAAAAERVKYRGVMERAVGDATAVMGEEVPKEQKELSDQEAANGNDRHMTAILARKGVIRGMHRADVYGVADWSRRAMRDNATRFFSETDEEVTSYLLDTIGAMWTPVTEVQQEAWNVAFWATSPADVLFGVDARTGTMPVDPEISTEEVEDIAIYPCVHDGVEYDTPCYYHAKVREGLTTTPRRKVGSDPAESRREVYPIEFPYKPFRVSKTKTKVPNRTMATFKTHNDRCGHCGHYHRNNPWYVRGVKAAAAHVHTKGRGGDAECAKKCKLSEPPNPGLNCPAGALVDQWRAVLLGSLVPESASSGTLDALRRALHSFAEMVYEGRKDFWLDQAREMHQSATMRSYLEDQAGVGTGVETDFVLTVDMIRNWCGGGPLGVEEADGAKDARRFALLQTLTNLEDRNKEEIYDAFTITSEIALPGTNRWNETLLDMSTGLIHVGKDGTDCVDGVQGTFVSGVPGVIEHQRMVQDGRKVVKFLHTYMGYIALACAGRPNGL